MSLVLVTSDRFGDHVPPSGHPERPERAVVMREVAARWRARGGPVLAPRAATPDELLRVHAAGYLDRLASSAGTSTALDLDTYTSPGSWDTALLAAGAALVAVEHVLRPPPGGSPVEGPAGAFALVRPPGHHALRDRAMGFCLLNNVALAAAHALACGARRVAIVDYDVHHGNGTQWCFYGDPRVLFVSMHEYPFYPQTGSAGECGVGAGEGFTVNVPLEAGATDADYLFVLRAVVEPLLSEYAADVLILDAGFDAHERDPLAHMHVSTGGFGRIAARLRRAAEASCGGRLVLVTEGGYDLEALDGSLQATIDAVESAGGAREEPAGERATGQGTAAVKAARAAQKRYWPAI